MGDLKDQISEGIKAAMKAKDKTRLNVLRYLKKLFIENDTSGKPKPELDIVISYAKKLKDSLSLYPENGPQALEIKKELEVISEFTPKEMTEEEVKGLIDIIIQKMDSPNMGAIMKELSPQIKGRFDGKRSSQMVQEALKN